ncbi:beta-3-deoxy-D-manno-oct-2-ulosonic acid transferase [Advenella sp. S44]|uniref:capsular polysaccharide biosynthesis protein n=1 Tax=Advenella sp. S44 TaxID=1982755 RepID=UPI000C2B215B|nr:capsular polysaccharide biosynthesis protein [Advenella sp. S44]PJX20546.1 beta-3-deoxy-D-manno-oct-2-ulosonic acid transferase [Advenella sp. S44]
MTDRQQVISGKRVSFYAVSALDIGLWRNRKLPAFLDAPLKIACFGTPNGAVRLGWGRKKSGLRAVRMAAAAGTQCCLLEDGFLRSVGLGVDEPALSLLFDHQGIYYDAGCPSWLEHLVAQPLDVAAIARTQSLISLWRRHRVSKYNHLPEFDGPLPARYVLLADQTFGDASLRYGQASAQDFTAMLESALQQHVDCSVLIKVHPDVFAGHKTGHFDLASLQNHPRVTILADNVHPVRLIEQAQAVYTVTSQIGFEALLWDTPVFTFGMPFYAGYGLTTDAKVAPARRQRASREQLVHAALVRYARYLDPETGALCEPERLIEWMGLQRRMRHRFAAPVYAPNFSRWKKPIVQRFFQGAEVQFLEKASDFPGEGTLAVWGRAADTQQFADQRVFLEDGFLRSVGLGADLVQPLSWVIDRSGIYYDSGSTSDLENILQASIFDDALRQRARALRERIVAANLTKYNVGSGRWQRPASATRVILVPGQVETDASIKYGSPVVRRNMDLLKAVRNANPDAYVVYKPHPDVVAGLRDAGQNEQQALQWCDEVVVDCPIGELFALVDEVHVLTSLAGFEALLRGRRVVTFGQPFYAGWGLTQDQYPVARRTRTLTLDELVAGVLILYPAYVSRRSARYTTPENALDELLDWKASGVSAMPPWRKALRPVLGFIAWLRGKR